MAPLGCHQPEAPCAPAKTASWPTTHHLWPPPPANATSESSSTSPKSSHTSSSATLSAPSPKATCPKEQMAGMPPTGYTSSTHPGGAMIVALVITIRVLWCICSETWWREKGKEKRVHVAESNHDWEYKSQDRLNKSLRWKRLKKCCGRGAGAREVVPGVVVVPCEKVGVDGEKVEADVIAVKGVSSRPLNVWEVSLFDDLGREV